MAPADRRVERLLARRTPAAAREEPEAVVEPVDDLTGREVRDLRRRQLDGQGDPVEPTTDLRDITRHGGGHGERGVHERRSRGEELRRLRILRRTGHEPEWPYRVHLLARHLERFTARRQDRHRRAALEHLVDERRAGVDHVLTVVDDEQHLAFGQEVDQLARRITGPGPDGQAGEPDGRSERRRHDRDVPHRREVDEENPVREPLELLGRGFDRQPRLAAAPHAGQGHESRALEVLLHHLPIVEPADEGRACARQVGAHPERAQRWEVVGKVRVEQLVDPLGPGEVPQAMQAEIAQGQSALR